MGKDSKGNRLRDRFPLACLCLLSPRRESRPPEATGQGGRIAQASGESAARSENRPLRRGRKQDEGFSRCGATPFLLAEKKRGKETARGDLFRGGPLWTPSPTTKGAPPPLDSPLLDEGRETGGWTGKRIATAGVRTGFAIITCIHTTMNEIALPPSWGVAPSLRELARSA